MSSPKNKAIRKIGWWLLSVKILRKKVILLPLPLVLFCLTHSTVLEARTGAGALTRGSNFTQEQAVAVRVTQNDDVWVRGLRIEPPETKNQRANQTGLADGRIG
uniref:Uncharacterized protein n=1 Tax=Anopheles coluzzii TaxID=1518534 RepID=A0A8W7NYU2_ANOCL